ncbi:nucleoside deaminase [Microbacterium fluvii]|uniref:Nucleoside deaminase n=1 Tax=Microbacterium fluvii TaxID=415215 RepID=A0ABW2HFG9_9MICO|nr:nucleoside deaminase [Microbacterium fluvii]MCU4671829.1 nucleoside deaminase [Microbacterium fluvii]
MTARTDEDYIRLAIEVSARARANGNHPFGAILIGPDGEVVLEAENTVTTGNDVTNHAETNLVRMTCQAVPESERRSYTLYTSCEPCAMCSGAIYWAGIGRVAYGLAETALFELTGSHPENPTLALPCRTVFAAGTTGVDVRGPLLESEAAIPHRDFWTS